MYVIHNGQKLKYINDFYGRDVLWIVSPDQITMPGMTFVGGYPSEYCIFIDKLTIEEQSEIYKQIFNNKENELTNNKEFNHEKR